MKRNNKALYEQIMRNVSKEVKKTLNEFNYWYDRTWMVGGTGAAEDFFDKTNEFFDDWCSTKAGEVINELITNGQITDGMDWYDAWDLVEDQFQKLLDQAVGGDWWETGKKLGYDDDDLDRLYTDVMQAKTDELADFCDNDVIVLSDEDEDDEGTDIDMNTLKEIYNNRFKTYRTEDGSTEEIIINCPKAEKMANQLYDQVKQLNDQIQLSNPKYKQIYNLFEWSMTIIDKNSKDTLDLGLGLGGFDRKCIKGLEKILTILIEEDVKVIITKNLPDPYKCGQTRKYKEHVIQAINSHFPTIKFVASNPTQLCKQIIIGCEQYVEHINEIFDNYIDIKKPTNRQLVNDFKSIFN